MVVVTTTTAVSGEEATLRNSAPKLGRIPPLSPTESCKQVFQESNLRRPDHSSVRKGLTSKRVQARLSVERIEGSYPSRIFNQLGSEVRRSSACQYLATDD